MEQANVLIYADVDIYAVAEALRACITLGYSQGYCISQDLAPQVFHVKLDATILVASTIVPY